MVRVCRIHSRPTSLNRTIAGVVSALTFYSARIVVIAVGRRVHVLQSIQRVDLWIQSLPGAAAGRDVGRLGAFPRRLASFQLFSGGGVLSGVSGYESSIVARRLLLRWCGIQHRAGLQLQRRLRGFRQFQRPANKANKHELLRLTSQQIGFLVHVVDTPL